MKKMKKLLALVLALAAVLSLAVGCQQNVPEDPNEFTEDVDPNRTQLYVGYYNGGLGMVWLKEVKAAFEKLYPDYQIMIDPDKDAYMDSQLEGSIKINRQDMYIDAQVDYYDFIKKGLIVDVTDAMTTPLTEFGENKSIADKMNDSLKAYYQTSDGKYYGSPYMEAYHHMIYDVDLFDEYNLWFKDGGGFVSSPDDKKSAGQDGEYGTWDDGLPVTYSDFFKMMDCMVARGITPLTWSGQYADAYLTNFLKSVIADYEGEKFGTYWSYNGEVDVIVNKNFTEAGANRFELADGDVQTVTVTNDNFADYMYRTTGKYFALKFAKDIVSNPMYRKYNYAESHTAVQRSFLMSNMEGVDQPIAMLIEGNWWINEATEVFKEMAEYDSKYAKENRRFGVMPIPKADDGSSASGHTVNPFSGGDQIFISSTSTKKDIAILFYRFLHTEQAMQLFTKHSGILKPFEYDLTSIYDSLHPYVQSFVDQRENTEYIYMLPTVDKYKEDKDSRVFMQFGGLLRSRIFESTSSNPMSFFCDNSQYSAKDYLLGMEYIFATQVPAAMK